MTMIMRQNASGIIIRVVSFWWLLALFLGLSLMTSQCDGLANKSNSKWQETLQNSMPSSLSGLLPKTTTSNNNDDQEKYKKKAQSDIVLQQLQMTSQSYQDPKAFSVDAQNWPSILGASLPALFRLGQGALAEGYQLNIVDRDDSKYTILAFQDKQLQESSQIKNKSNSINNDNLQPLVLYDREGSIPCRLVRESCSMLSLPVTIRPCPVNGLQFASQTNQGKSIPMLEDPNTSVKFQTQDNNNNNNAEPILTYLFKTYGNGEIPFMLLDGKNLPIATVTTGLAMLSRFGAGSRYKTSDPPALPLVLWTYESSPFCKVVTETLGSYEIEYTAMYCPRGSPNRQMMRDQVGRFQVPFLQDPNTGVELWESASICEYLDKQYGVKTPVAYL